MPLSMKQRTVIEIVDYVTVGDLAEILNGFSPKDRLNIASVEEVPHDRNQRVIEHRKVEMVVVRAPFRPPAESRRDQR